MWKKDYIQEFSFFFSFFREEEEVEMGCDEKKKKRTGSKFQKKLWPVHTLTHSQKKRAIHSCGLYARSHTHILGPCSSFCLFVYHHVR